MRDRIDLDGPMPRFWEPRPSRLWKFICTPLHHWHAWHHRIATIRIDGLRRLREIPPADGVLICLNHSYTGDASVAMQIARKSRKTTCIMAAWHVFRGHRGLDGWLLQRQGLFSVDREGCDRRALRTATELLSSGKGLIIFPEGEIYHLNERLTPLREGVAFIALTARKELDKAESAARVWIVPGAIRYRFVGRITHRVHHTLSAMEKRLMLRPKPGMPLHQRIINLGEVLLTIKEKEHLGRSHESDGDLRTRIAGLTRHLLANREQTHFGKTNADEPVPVRVKLLRRHLLQSACDPEGEARIGDDVRDALADVHLALQLYSYPGDYLSTEPTIERMAETLEKFEEDLYGVEARPAGWRRARVVLGEPIAVDAPASRNTRTAAAELTGRLERHMQELMSRDPGP